MTFRIARSIFIALLAVAIATPPLAVGPARAAPPAIAIVSTDQPAADCDHHSRETPSERTQHTKHVTCAVGCALCIVFVDTDVSVVAYAVPIGTALKPALALNRLSSLMGSPPFRPPRA